MTYALPDAIAALESVCKGEATATPRQGDPYKYYCGDVHYDLSNGWQAVVFNDCAEWDYVSYVIAPDGTEFDGFPEGKEACWEIANWHPSCAKADDGCPHYGFYSQPNEPVPPNSGGVKGGNT